jgi:large subunit ribosomal protein L11
MKKKRSGTRNITLICGQARPGANLAFLKVMPIFCKEFNEKTKNKSGEPVNVEIIVYADGSYKYEIGTSPSSYVIKKTLGEKKEITQAELEKVTQEVMTSLNTDEIEQAKKVIVGTIRSFGNIKIKE